MRWAVIDSKKIVVNVVEWDGERPWTPPEGCEVVQHDTADIGDDLTPKKPKK